MPSIIIRRDGKPVREVAVEKDLTLIGQSPGADIQIEDPEALAERASIMKIGENFILNELGANDATYVNGKPAKKCVLKDRDLIIIGEYRLTFQDKRENDNPQGVEAQIQSQLEIEGTAERLAERLNSGRNKKAERTTFLVFGAIVVGIFLSFWGYQSYVARQTAKAMQAEMVSQEARKKDAPKFQDSAKAFESSIKRRETPAETPATEPRP
ncbi:MAG: FHA domain-containing protein [Sterolibacterium sp.]|nr:FHA domain-containing protein [Sterolibacterium sp.]